jgi:hypothetical protein
MTDEKIVITSLKRDGSKSHNRDDLTIKNFQGDLDKMKNYVGPAFIFCNHNTYISRNIRIRLWTI